MCPITGLAVNQVVQFKLTQRHVNRNAIINEIDETDSYIKPLKRREGEGVIQRYLY